MPGNQCSQPMLSHNLVPFETYILTQRAAYVWPQDEEAAPLITAEQVASAAAAARPSISPSERMRLEAVYARFQQGRDPGLGGSAASKGKGKRATLA